MRHGLGLFGDVPEDAVRQRAVDLVRQQLPCDAGSAAFEEIAQGRERQTRIYSSCGDLAHWLLWRLGYKGPVLNRNVPSLGLKWQMGMNIGRIRYTGERQGLWVPFTRGSLPALGDICMITDPAVPNREHVFVALAVDGVRRLVTSGDAGQVNAKGQQCARFVNRTVLENGRTVAEDGRMGRFLAGWLDISHVDQT